MRVGERIGHLVIDRRIGAGGMGEVYLARDERLERAVAIKVLPDERALDPAARSRMLREARAASSLHHPGIVTVHDIGEHQGRVYIVMEFVDGETLEEVLATRVRLPPAEAVELLAKIGDAVAAAHEAGVLHRDLKPANLIVDRRGQPRVLDFGLSKRTPRASTPTPVPPSRPSVSGEAPTVTPESEPTAETVVPEPADLGSDATTPAPSGERREDDALTVHGARMGTPGYAALELIDGEEADARSDVFALGVILYRMVTGALPFPQVGWRALRTAMEKPSFVAASAAARTGLGGLDEVLARALAPAREDRFATVGELIAAARDAVATPAAAPRRTARIAVAGVALVGAGVAAAVLAMRGTGGDTPPAAEAAQPAIDAAPRPRVDPASRRQLTRAGGCAESPVFADDETIVYTLLFDGGTDLHRVGRDGATAPLATGKLREWRPSSGARPGDVVYLVTSDDVEAGYLAERSVSGGDERVIARVDAAAVAHSGGAYYYIDHRAHELRRLRDGRNELFLKVPPEYVAETLAVDPTGRRLAFTSLGAGGFPMVCLVDVATATIDCENTKLGGARPAFTADGSALYHDHPDGIGRIDLATGVTEVVVPGGNPKGGLAVSPRGDLMVWSECEVIAPIEEVTARPPRRPIDDRWATTPRTGSGGRWAYVRLERTGDTLVYVAPDGERRELVTRDAGRLSSLAFSPDGESLAYARSLPDESGIFVVATRNPRSPRQLTTDPGDRRPLYLSNEEILFTRTGADGTPRLHRVGLDGGEPVVVPGPGRVALKTDLGKGRVLVMPPDGERLLWWDPATGRSSPGPRLKVPLQKIFELDISPDGAWLAYIVGEAGGTVFRAPLSDPSEPEALHSYPYSTSLGVVSVFDDGRVLVDLGLWYGELHAMAASSGMRL